MVGKVGQTVEDVLKEQQLMEAACDGYCQCSTCHCFVIQKEFRDKLGMPEAVEDFELDMLELAPVRCSMTSLHGNLHCWYLIKGVT